MRRALAAIVLSGCHSYQRDPSYALARLQGVAREPFHPDNSKYTLAFLALVALVTLALGLALMAARRR